MGNGLEYSHASSFAALPTAFRYSFHQADAADAVAARFSHQVDAADPFAAIVWQARGWDFHTRWLRPILFASIVWQAAARGGPSCLRPRWGGQGRAAASGGQSHLARRRGARVWPAGCRRDAMSITSAPCGEAGRRGFCAGPGRPRLRGPRGAERAEELWS
ncbi:unnamed protein product, partial [Prorocentrum cordatum]